MYLRSLAIRGFKSFARKTVLEFEPGVTIIVGPNGSGKSNIADAIMWVLGEQSPTSLRGNRMEDVIFSGSTGHRPKNMAEVVLTLDNENNDFPLDFSEVTISRNVVRGGDSEYRLNDTSCRLLDIQEMLSDCGVGRTLNSVISQGQLDDVLSCRPEERRDYIEEAGGLLKFKRRREKALRRLDRMDEEVVRINDVIREVRRQLRPLRRQAGRLEQYQSIKKDLNESRIRLDVARLRIMQRDWEAHQETQGERKKRLGELEEELSRLNSEVRSIETGEDRWREQESSKRERLYRLVSLHEQLKALQPVWESKRKLTRSGANSGVESADPDELARRNRALETRRLSIEGRLESLRSEEAGQSEIAAGLNKTLDEVIREIVGLETRLEVLDNAGGGLAAAGGLRVQELERKLGSLEEESRSALIEINGLREGIADAREKVTDLESEVREQISTRERAQDRLREVEADQAQLLARLNTLESLESEKWGIRNSARALIQDDPTSGGLEGLLAEDIEIDETYETAITGFLGPWLYGIVAKRTDSIHEAVRYLKEKGLGQALFFGHPGPTDRDTSAGFPVPPGARRALDVVKAPERFSGALEALLGDVLLVDDLETAFEMAEKHQGFVFLSIEGDAVLKGTLVKGGSPTVSQAHLEMNRSRRRKLEESLQRRRSELEELELQIRATRNREADIARDLEAGRADLERLNSEYSKAAERRATIEAGVESTRNELEYWNSEGFLTGKDIDLESERARLDELRGRERTVRVEHREAENTQRRTLELIMRAEAELAAVRHEQDVAVESEHRAALSLGTLENDDGEGDQLETRYIDRIEGLHQRLQTLVRESRERIVSELEAGSDRLEGASERLKSIRDEVISRQRDHDRLRELVHAEDLSRAELKIKVEQLVGQIVDGHKVPLEFALEQYRSDEPTEDLEKRVAELEDKMEHIGPVNPEAISEKEALEERHDFLKGQLDDVDEAKKQLQRVVREIDKQIKKKFKETTEKVDEHFREIFGFLFPKGRAELRLTDPDDLLNTGVEMFAQPEGKKLRRISLLSGGETSLTAIAFFFALFRVRPSPFYFLDEVEAALDDVNLHRFLQLVGQFKDESQLVLITHQKRSMEIADSLYGVSMHEDGVSKVVSQRIAS